MKIALLTDGIYPYVMGGMQKHSYYLAKYLANNNIDVDVYHCVPSGTEHSYVPVGLADYGNLRFVSLKFPKLRFPGHYFVESYLYSKKLYFEIHRTKVKYDFVYAQGFTSWFFVNKNGGQFIIGTNFHGFNAFQKSFNLRSRIENLFFRSVIRHVLKKTDVIFSLGPNLTGLIKDISDRLDQEVIESPTALEESWLNGLPQFEEKHEQIRKFVFVGRYDPVKGIENLNLVFEDISGDKEFLFTHVGYVPEENKINHKNVVYTGELFNEKEIRKILLEADVLICPSFSEGMPISILEAMACGCAIIGTDVGDVGSLISDSNGWLIPARNNKELKKAILSSMEIPQEKLNGMKDHSKMLVQKKFLWDIVVKDLIKQINHVINKN